MTLSVREQRTKLALEAEKHEEAMLWVGLTNGYLVAGAHEVSLAVEEAKTVWEKEAAL